MLGATACGFPCPSPKYYSAFSQLVKMLFTQNPKIGKSILADELSLESQTCSASFAQFFSIFYKLYNRSRMPEECDLISGFRLANLWFFFSLALQPPWA
jgi:hypothetical protein